MAVDNGHGSFFFVTLTEELLRTRPAPILCGPRVYRLFVSSMYFSSVVTTVVNLKIKTALNSCRIPEGTRCACYPNVVFNYDSRQCLNVAGPDKPTRILPQILSKDKSAGVWLFIQTSVVLSVYWLRQVMHHCS